MKKNNDPWISIILCFLNAEKFLDKAIRSVRAQDCNDWELLLIDRGSNEGSVSIAKNYAEQFPEKIKYFQNYERSDNISSSRNEGIKKARGQYITFIEAEEVWLMQKLSYQLSLFDIYPEAGVVLEASLLWNSWCNNMKPDVIVPIGIQEGVYHPPHLIMSLYPLGKGYAPRVSSMMIHRSAIDQTSFEESFQGIFKFYEDQAFLCKIYLKEVIYVSSRWHTKYRNISSSEDESLEKTRTVRDYYIQWLESYLKTERASYKLLTNSLYKTHAAGKSPFRIKLQQEYSK